MTWNVLGGRCTDITGHRLAQIQVVDVTDTAIAELAPATQSVRIGGRSSSPGSVCPERIRATDDRGAVAAVGSGSID